MPKIPTRMRGALDRKVEKLSRTNRLSGKNLQRVMTRMDRLNAGSTTTTTVPRRRATTTTTLPPKRKPTKHDKLLLGQGFTRKELGLD